MLFSLFQCFHCVPSTSWVSPTVNILFCAPVVAGYNTIGASKKISCALRRTLCPKFKSASAAMQGTTKTSQPIFTRFGGNVEHRPRKNPLDIGGNPDHVMLGLGLE